MAFGAQRAAYSRASPAAPREVMGAPAQGAPKLRTRRRPGTPHAANDSFHASPALLTANTAAMALKLQQKATLARSAPSEPQRWICGLLSGSGG